MRSNQYGGPSTVTSGRCPVTVNSIFPCVCMCVYEQESQAQGMSNLGF